MSAQSIEGLGDNGVLSTLIMSILEKIGLEKVVKVSDYVVTANEKSAFGIRPYLVICTLSELNGKVQLIKSLISEHTISEQNIIVVSSNTKISNYFKNWLKGELKTDKIDFWNSERVEELVNQHLPEYWGHNDVFLKKFEDAFLASLQGRDELQQVLKLDPKYDDLLNIFIEPKITFSKEDIQTGRTLRTKFKVDRYLTKNNFFISGDAGTGKSTLLKEIGQRSVDRNINSVDKTLPIRLKSGDIAQANYNLKEAISNEVSSLIGDGNLKKVYEDYHILLLLDSIDELEVDKQQALFKELKSLCELNDLNFVIATRNYEKLTKECDICENINTQLSNFDLSQVKQYVTKFFRKDLKKSEDLWDNLLENKILEKIPSTPLTISLVSILYEENGYEVPATITDVFDNFNTFLLGRLNVSSNLDFLKINVKEKILSMYALSIIGTANRRRMYLKDFVEYVINYFKGQSITIEEGVIPDLVRSMTDGTGVLYVDEHNFVTYQHDHFMEYYASREIFYEENRSELEKQIIQKFTEFNWQNTAIFYTGRTKNMPIFLDKLVARCDDYTAVNDQLLAVSGLGFVLQSLWMTNSENRKNAVLQSLRMLLKADAGIKTLAQHQFAFFKGIDDLTIAISNLAWFFFHYNSITLRDPLQLAFDQLKAQLKTADETVFLRDRTSLLFQLFCIAATLNTGRVKDTSRLEALFEEDKLLNIPLFVFLFNEAFEVLEYSNEARLRKEFKIDTKKRRYARMINFYLENKSDAVIHTTFQQLAPIKNVEIFAEGKTDATIISHAFRVLTMGEEPYWNITAAENILGTTAGGAQQLAVHLKTLSETIVNPSDLDKTVIGIFDNDEKGFQEFNGLPVTFKSLNGILKHFEGTKIYALLLPIPNEDSFSPYKQDKQRNKYFAIEHYFPQNLLEEHNMVTASPIQGIYEITGNKNSFAEYVLKLGKPEIFKEFEALFDAIDEVAGKNGNYCQTDSDTV
ncbi:MAG: NACHT domain-containing protein [Pedobacter sp.]|nr:MAG: NACHT domain-containing protein [Pedobacter sp.]